MWYSLPRLDQLESFVLSNVGLVLHDELLMDDITC